MLLSDVCLSRTSAITREQRDLYEDQNWHTGTHVSRHTWIRHHFQGQKAPTRGEGAGHLKGFSNPNNPRGCTTIIGFGKTYVLHGVVPFQVYWYILLDMGPGLEQQIPLMEEPRKYIRVLLLQEYICRYSGVQN